MWTFIFARPHGLVVLQLISSALSQSGETDIPPVGLSSQLQVPSGDGDLQSPPETSLVFTVIPSPPYSTNVSGTWYDIEQLDPGMLRYLFQNCNCLQQHRNISIKTVAGKDELEKLVKTNRTDFAFPLFLPIDTKSTYKRLYLPCSSHPGLDLFVIPESQNPGEVIVKTLLSSWPLLALSVILTGMAGIIMWILEVFYNRDEFPKSFARGSWEGFWWAFISMTTVGYGDKCPRTIAGRCFAVLWILAGFVLVSVFTANVTTALTSTTYGKQEYRLDGLTVGVLKNGIEKSYAKGKGAETKDFTSFADLINALKDKDVKGILVDRYVMGYYLENFPDSGIISTLIRNKHYPMSQLYTFGVVAASMYAEKIIRECFINPDNDDEYTNQHEQLNLDMVVDGKEFENTGLRRVKTRSTNEYKKSFNLFVDSKQHFQKVTYISFGVLAAFVSFGIMMDMAISKKKRQKTQEHELKVSEHDQLLQDIKKGHELLSQLQSFLQNIEEKVKNQKLISPRYSPTNERFS